MPLSRLLFSSALLTLFLGLTSCGGKLGITNWSAPQSYRSFERTLTEPDRPALVEVGKLLKEAAELSAKNPDQAVDLYLEVAERTVAKSTTTGDEAKIYRHAVGQAMALIHSGSGQNTGTPTRHKISYAKGKNLFDPALFDSISFADASEVANIDIQKQAGIGAPMVGRIEYSEEHKKAHPFLHRAGIDSTATAVVEFPSKGHARITLCNTRRSDQLYFRGAKRTLAANFTTPLISTILHQQTKGLGLKGILKPADFIDEMGLYCIEIIDPNRIPVIFTHGLASKPATWVTPYNALLGEKWFRENYQVYAFYYPSGLPPMYPAAGLREGLARMHKELKRQGAGRNADRVVLVGHSMGGLMTSFQIRDFRGTADQFFTSPIEDLPISDRSRKALHTMLETAPPRFVKRAIFVATPHRGSYHANGWIGRLGSKLAKVPLNLLTLQLPEVRQSLTSFGRELTGGENGIDGVARLKTDDPLLAFTLQQPVAYGTPVHSIVGDRGKGGGRNRGDDPESSDGVVPYWSSHLDGAVSEKIVPSNHSAHVNPEAIEELKRILHLHLSR